jgi:hypothetical protein
MENQDRQAIEGLFSRLAAVERQAGPKDDEAEALIRDQTRQNPSAPYFMAQTIVMQDYALKTAEARIAELERQPAQRQGGGLLGGLFGGGQQASGPWGGSAAQRARRDEPEMAAPQPFQQPGRGGGFLAGAAQTAIGVAGGVLLSSAIGSMFGGSSANAAEPGASSETAEAAPAEAPASEEGGGFLDSFFGGDDSEF